MQLPDKPHSCDLEFLRAKASEPSKIKSSAASTGEDPIKPFPIEALPPPLRSVALSLSRYSRLNLAFHGLAALTVASAAVGSSLTTQSQYFTSPTPCNLLVALCTNTTGGKGILESYSEPIHNYEEEQILNHESGLSRSKVALNILKRKLRELEKLIDRVTNDITKEHLIDQAAAMTTQIDQMAHQMKSSPCLTLSRCNGAVLRNTLIVNGGACFLYSVEGGGHLLNAFNGADPLMADLLLSSFSYERQKIDTLGSHLRGRPCLAGLFALQTWRLREILFSRDAAPLGFLNRLLIVDAENLPFRDKDPHLVKDTAAQKDWHKLISNILDFRHSRVADLKLPLTTDAEAIFEGFRREVEEIIESHDTSVGEQFGRFAEIAMRIFGVFIAVESIGVGYPIFEIRAQRLIAEDAVILTRWFMEHRLDVHEQQLEVHYHRLATELGKVLSEKGGEIDEIELKASHAKLAQDLEGLLSRYSERFSRHEKRKGKRGPATRVIMGMSIG